MVPSSRSLVSSVAIFSTTTRPLRSTARGAEGLRLVDSNVTVATPSPPPTVRDRGRVEERLEPVIFSVWSGSMTTSCTNTGEMPSVQLLGSSQLPAGSRLHQCSSGVKRKMPSVPSSKSTLKAN